jgi:predicted HTH transcriptional regulator
MKIEELIKLNEGVSLDFKEKLPSPDDLAKLLVAFSNTKGGKIVVGITDKTRKIKGLELDLNVEEYVMNVASNNCLPLISPSLEFISYRNKLVAVVEVPAGEQKPYQVKKLGAEKGVYVRIGSTNRLADKALRAELGRESRNMTFDKLGVEKAAFNDFDVEKIKRYQELKERRMGTPPEKINEDYLEKINAYRKSNGKRVPTIGGLLLFGKAPQSITDLPRAIIKAARFRGREKGFIIDQTVIEGNLPEQIDQSVQFILKNIRISGKIKGLKRIDRPEYPLAAFREAITNAVVHRDYFLADSMSIFIAIFDDRIEIESPGMLPQGVTVENIREKQRTRNPLIARILFEMDYFDEWGQGIERMFKAMKDAALPEPVLKEETLSFIVTLKKAKGKSKMPKVPVAVSPKSALNERQKWVMEYLEKHVRITTKEFKGKFKEVSLITIKRDLSYLRQNNKIKFVGAPKKGYYTLAK